MLPSFSNLYTHRFPQPVRRTSNQVHYIYSHWHCAFTVQLPRLLILLLCTLASVKVHGLSGEVTVTKCQMQLDHLTPREGPGHQHTIGHAQDHSLPLHGHQHLQDSVVAGDHVTSMEGPGHQHTIGHAQDHSLPLHGHQHLQESVVAGDHVTSMLACRLMQDDPRVPNSERDSMDRVGTLGDINA